MRINVYAEELTGETEVVSKVAETGITYYAARLFLESSPKLHNRPDDDDRTAITFWIPDTATGKEVLLQALEDLCNIVSGAPLATRA